MTIITPQVAPVYDLGTRADYLEFGVGSKKNRHKSAGTDRLGPGSFCDLPSVDEFVALGNELAEQHGRKVKAQSYITSGSPDEFNVNNRDDLKRLGDVAYLLAKKMHPNSPVLVVVHADGGSVHAHHTVLNHDYTTGMALRAFRVHWQVRRANDELMHELGVEVLETKPKLPTHAWTTRRADLSEFDQQLGDAITEALADTSSTDFDGFIAACAARGVQVVRQAHEVTSNGRRGKQQGNAAIGVTYKMRDSSDEQNKPGRLRRRKASALSTDFTYDGVTSALVARQAPTHGRTPIKSVVETTLGDRLAEEASAITASSPGRGGSRFGSQVATTAARAAVSRGRARSVLLSRLEGVLMEGLFASLPGYVSQCAKVGVLAFKYRSDLAYKLAGHKHRWDPTELGEPYTAIAISELAEEIGELRSSVPAAAQLLAVPQLLKLLENEDPQIRQHREQKTAQALTPARERHLSIARGDRSFGD